MSTQSDFNLMLNEVEALRKQNETLRQLLAKHGIRVNVPSITAKIHRPPVEQKDKTFEQLSGGERTKLYQNDKAEYNRLKFTNG